MLPFLCISHWIIMLSCLFIHSLRIYYLFHSFHVQCLMYIQKSSVQHFVRISLRELFFFFKEPAVYHSSFSSLIAEKISILHRGMVGIVYVIFETNILEKWIWINHRNAKWSEWKLRKLLFNCFCIYLLTWQINRKM